MRLDDAERALELVKKIKRWRGEIDLLQDAEATDYKVAVGFSPMDSGPGLRVVVDDTHVAGSIRQMVLHGLRLSISRAECELREIGLVVD